MESERPDPPHMQQAPLPPPPRTAPAHRDPFAGAAEPRVASVAASGDASAEGFGRLAPSSLFFGIGGHAKALLVPAIVVLLFTHKGSWELWFAILFVPSALLELYRYLTLRYRIAGDELIVRQGLLVRSERIVPLARIQNIDMVQNVLHRLFGVAEIHVSTAAGSEPEAVFKVLSIEAANALRGQVDAARGHRPRHGSRDVLAAGAQGVAGETPLDAPLGSGLGRASDAAPDVDTSQAPRPILRIPLLELVKLGLISNRGTAAVLVVLGAAWQFDLLDRLPLPSMDWETIVRAGGTSGLAGWTTLLLFVAAAMALLRLLSMCWVILKFHGYELVRIGDDLRMSCGLLTRVTATVPRSRIQLVSIRQSLFQRWLGRASIRIETAGGLGGGDADLDSAAGTLGRRWFVPTIVAEDVPRILRELRPGLDEEFGSAAWRSPAPRALARTVRGALIVGLPIAAAASFFIRPWGAMIGATIAAFLLWQACRDIRFRGYARTARGLFFREGAWTRLVGATFFDKMQVASLRESPFDRRWKMATVRVDTAGAGPAEQVAELAYLPRGEAVELLDELSRRTDEAAFRW